MSLREKLDELMSLYNDIKKTVKQKDRNLFDRWKAGGFLVDDDIVSMYPNIMEVVEDLDNDDDDNDDDDDDNDDE